MSLKNSHQPGLLSSCSRKHSATDATLSGSIFSRYRHVRLLSSDEVVISILAGNLADMSKAERIFQLAQDGADTYHMFKARHKGAGAPYVNEVINHLKFLVAQEFGTGAVNQFLSKEARHSVDFSAGG